LQIIPLKKIQAKVD